MYKHNIFFMQPLLPWKAKSITYFKCKFVAYAKLSCVAYLVLKYLPHYLINGMTFNKNIIAHKMCFDFIYNFCLKHFSF